MNLTFMRGRETSAVPAETHMSSVPVSRDEVLAFIRDLLGEILEVDGPSIAEDDRLADDLAMDSLALIELVEAVEQEYGERTVGFRVDDEDLSEFATVRDAVDYVVSRVS